MKKQDANSLIRHAESATITGLGEKAALAADLLHADHATYLPFEYAAALLHWQAFQFNGQWDVKALNETLYWMRRATLISNPADLPEATRAAMLTLEGNLPTAISKGRFASLEV